MKTASASSLTNAVLASYLREFADLLEQQGADGFRVEAYRRAASEIAQTTRSIVEIFDSEGRQGLIALPAVGRSIASALAELLITGRWSQLERLRGTLEPEGLLCTIPGIGPKLAERICAELHIESLEALEVAVHDGRLEGLRGFGRRRVQMVRSALAERLGRPRLWTIRRAQPRPSVAILLDLDREYRDAAAGGKLRKIAPRRFNPERRAWQPVLHARTGPWEMTALYSNTARAHELGKTGDWVVIYYQSDRSPEGQCTIVTETRGADAGRRVVRGREDECLALRRSSAVRRGLAIGRVALSRA